MNLTSIIFPSEQRLFCSPLFIVLRLYFVCLFSTGGGAKPWIRGPIRRNSWNFSKTIPRMLIEAVIGIGEVNLTDKLPLHWLTARWSAFQMMVMKTLSVSPIRCSWFANTGNLYELMGLFYFLKFSVGIPNRSNLAKVAHEFASAFLLISYQSYQTSLQTYKLTDIWL